MKFLTDMPARAAAQKPKIKAGGFLLISALSAAAAAAAGSAAASAKTGAALAYGKIKHEAVFVKKTLKRAGFSEFVTEDGKILIKEKKLSRKKFLDWIREDRIVFLSQFDPSPSPYAGALSNQIDCAKRRKPRPIFPGGQKPAPIIEGLVYQSNSRFAAISCGSADGGPAHDSAYIAIHCGGGFGYKIAIHKKTGAGKAAGGPGMRETAAGFFCQPPPESAAKTPA